MLISMTIIQGCGEEKKMGGGGGGARENFSKLYGIKKLFGREGDMYKIFKSWGGVKNLLFPTDDLFLNKNTDFC